MRYTNPRLLYLLYLLYFTNRKNLLPFGADPVPDTDYGSLFHFPRKISFGENVTSIMCNSQYSFIVKIKYQSDVVT